MVAMGLQQPMAFTVIGAPLAILAPIVALLGLPRLPRVSLVGLLIRVGGHLVVLPLGFPGPLTGRVGAESLYFDTGIRHKAAPTIGAATLAIHGFLLCEAVDLQTRLVQEEYASQPKEKRKERQVREMRQKGKNNQRADA